MKDKLLKLGYKPSAKQPNPRCICCNLPVAQCGWRKK